jgi:hypothetical protein
VPAGLSPGEKPAPGDLPGTNLTGADKWPGEGDDMIFIDGEQWPPSLHGTGIAAAAAGRGAAAPPMAGARLWDE